MVSPVDGMTAPPGGQVARRYYGKYRGRVTDNDDPRDMGRLRARVKGLLEEVETGWALPCAPYTGAGAGQLRVPPIGAGVWIEFESGDLAHPIWSGCWWGEDQLPRDKGGAGATPALKILRSEKALMVALDDASETITVSDKSGAHMVELQVQQGKVTVKGTCKVVIEADEIELGEGATERVVSGDQLLQYINRLVIMFNTHVHPGLSPTPPAPPFWWQPATPTLLSKKVKSG